MIGKQIVNTRAAHQADALNALLRERGAHPVDYPCIAFAPPTDTEPMDAALRDLASGRYAWLILTSANAASALAERVKACGLALDSAAFRVAAVGAATAAAARAIPRIQQIDVTGDADGEALAAALSLEHGDRVLVPSSNLARPQLALTLAARGWNVRTVEAYQTVCGTGGADVPRFLEQGLIDAITFTSSSTVTYFLERLEREGGDHAAALSLPVGCIGAQTADTARARGFTDVTQPLSPTLAGMVDALARRL